MSIDTLEPPVPTPLDDENFDPKILSDLWVNICSELSDSSYQGRSHNAGTYEKGCRGPVCRKANREHYRRNATAGVLIHALDDRIYDPVVEYFHTVVKYRIRAAQQEILKELKGTG